MEASSSSQSIFFRRINNAKRSTLNHEDKKNLQFMVEEMREKMEIGIKIRDSEEQNFPSVEVDEVFTKYRFDKSSSTELPIHSVKQKIMKTIENNSSVVIIGNTGCGKSTQVPQFILDDAYAKKKPCNIIVTQPRRIAAKSIAQRVCFERGWDLGSVVGYQIGLDKRFVSSHTLVTFCTTAILLEKLIAKKSLGNFTHIILDEVHERQIDMDFLFVVIRRLMSQENANIKIILMSATIDSTQFAEYFKSFKDDCWSPAPVVDVDIKSSFTVVEYYLDDLITDRSVKELKWDSPDIKEPLYKSVPKLVSVLNEFDDDVVHLPSVLVFLPGIYEIGRMNTFLKEFAALNPSDRKWEIIVLHSLIATDEQHKVFNSVEEGRRKIILSTNIAESSITVPDVKYVIDFCLTKRLKMDDSRSFVSLEMDWTSKSSCRQRSGRAGRTTDGICFRMVPRTIFNALKETTIPEILITPLENVVLKAKELEMGTPYQVLGLAMDPPELEDIASTILLLKELGALLVATSDPDDQKLDGDITFLGKMMANLPINVAASKLIALGYCFSVLNECIVMAATLTVKGIFKINMDRKLDSYSRCLEWSDGSGSDLFAAYNAYQVWTMKYNQNEFGKSPEQRNAEKQFCLKYNLDSRSLHECHRLVLELTHRIEKLGIRQVTGPNHIALPENEKAIILKVVICGAFYPNYFTTELSNDPMVERDIFSELNGRDPNKTVYFTGLKRDRIRELYVNAIKDYFKNTVIPEDDLDRIHVSFDKGSDKVFVTFDTETVNVSDDWDKKTGSIPTRALVEVYKAIKMRNLGYTCSIPVVSKENEEDLALSVGIGYFEDDQFHIKCDNEIDLKNICIPNATVTELEGNVTHVESCSKFWFQPLGEKKTIEEYTHMLNTDGSHFDPWIDNENVDKRVIIAARDNKDGLIRRAQVLSTNTCQNGLWTVSFIDFGHTQKCKFRDLRKIKAKSEMSKMPARCFQACLAEIQPSSVHSSNSCNKWSHGAVKMFKEHVVGKQVTAKIYSVVNGIVNVFISRDSRDVNEMLIENQFGEYCEENFLSKEGNSKRKADQENFEIFGANALTNATSLDCNEYRPMEEAEAVSLPNNCPFNRNITLHGPNSPLKTTLNSVLNYGSFDAASIDANSVNCVLLNSIQQQSNIRYLVAASVIQQGNRQKSLSACGTTLLPSILGFGPLMALIFCPRAELKRDASKSRYISVLTGLGLSHDNANPLYPEHDIVFPLDFELGNDDIKGINEIRYAISGLLIGTQADGDTAPDNFSEKTRHQVMMNMKTEIIKLITKYRKPMKVIDEIQNWQMYGDKDFQPAADVFDQKSILPLHGTWKLHPMDECTKKMLRKHCLELHSMTFNFKPQECKLCATHIENSIILRIHLLSRCHTEREKEINFQY